MSTTSATESTPNNNHASARTSPVTENESLESFVDLQLSKELVEVYRMEHHEGKCGYLALAMMIGLEPAQIFDYLNDL
jgi:hypothetical protein